MIWTVYEIQEWFCGETLNPVPHLCEENKLKLCKCNVEVFFGNVFNVMRYSFLLWMSYVTMNASQESIVILKEATYLSLFQNN